MYLKKFFGHLSVVSRHKWGVFKNCVKCGIPLRGILHDLSKFSPTEFFESVKYFQGNRSPIGACRRDKGMSYAWLHHKGRNRHHTEYWYDPECAEQPLMPYKYAVECICDKLAATKTYAGKSYSPEMPLEHYKKYGEKTPTNKKTVAFITAAFTDLLALGEGAVLNKKYMKKKYAEICLSKE